ncbi:11865_t:CDS:2, partial [Cetraspora pellucida]
QVNTNEVLKEVCDQEKFKKLSNKEQDEIYVLYVFRTDLKIDNQYIFTD